MYLETSRPTITTYIRDDWDIVGDVERQDNSHFPVSVENSWTELLH